ncbi:hypothetical protein PVAND_009353 [Polypedilum vanderplanki]|uniref:UDP-glucuronosyltransferase n=1 Tax=Polypedilum vanderplanki TaxID=319348 RepID=A0A9J6CCW2_POLVA|nr:hypothetical protein PVAND_009353 [Polypedilum vanderplanki]
MLLLLKISIILLFSNFKTLKSANILAFSQIAAYSNYLFNHVIFKEFAVRGHNLTIFATYPSDYSQFPNVIQHHFNESIKIRQKYMNIIEYKQKSMSAYKIGIYDRDWIFEAIKSEIEHPEMQKILNNYENYQFDLIIGEFSFLTFGVLAEIFNCPIIITSSVEPFSAAHVVMGNFIDAAHYPISYLPYLYRNLTLSQRIESLFVHLYSFALFVFYYGIENEKIYEKYFPIKNIDHYKIYQERAALMIMNTNFAFGHIRPLMPNTIQVGFLHVEPPKKIQDEKLLTFLDNSKTGVIVMNFGSLSDTKKIKNSTIEKFLKVFNQTKFDVIIKLHKIDQEIPKNVLISDWLPLADVLAHSKVKIFIFHGGLFSAYEAIDREIPMIIFPFAYDQGSNARMLVHNEVAIELDFNTFTENELLEAIHEINLNDYKENVKKLKKRVYNQPISNKNLLIWHVEKILRNKDDLKIITNDMSSVFLRHITDIYIFCLLLIIFVRKIVKILLNIFYKYKNLIKTMKY